MSQNTYYTPINPLPRKVPTGVSLVMDLPKNMWKLPNCPISHPSAHVCLDDVRCTWRIFSPPRESFFPLQGEKKMFVICVPKWVGVLCRGLRNGPYKKGRKCCLSDKQPNGWKFAKPQGRRKGEGGGDLPCLTWNHNIPTDSVAWEGTRRDSWRLSQTAWLLCPCLISHYWNMGPSAQQRPPNIHTWCQAFTIQICLKNRSGRCEGMGKYLCMYTAGCNGEAVFQSIYGRACVVLL